MNLKKLFGQGNGHHHTLAESQIVPEPARCVQCGICSYNCPIGIDVRRHAWLEVPIQDSRCLTCGECVARCPRGVLHFKRTHLFETKGHPEAGAP